MKLEYSNWSSRPLLFKLSFPLATLGLILLYVLYIHDFFYFLFDFLHKNLHFTNFFKCPVLIIIPEFFLFTTLTLLLVFISTKKTFTNQKKLKQTFHFVKVIFLFVFAILYNFLPYKASVLLFNSFMIVDFYTNHIKIFIIFLAIVVLILAKKIIFDKDFVWEFLLLFGFSIFFMLLIVSAYNFIVLFLAVEGLALLFYTLIGLSSKTKTGVEAAIKYFYLGSLSAGLLLFSIYLFYISAGTLSFDKIAYSIKLFETQNSSETLSQYFLAVLTLLLSFFFKLAAFPNHFWSPDIYAGSNPTVVIIFALPMKVAMIGAFVRIFFCYFSPLLFFSISLVEISAAGSLFLGCLGALQSKTVNRFIAYTSINHIGFILLGLCNNALIDGLQYSFLYILNYVVMSITLFIVILNFKTSNGTYIKYITDFSLLENNTIKLCLTTVLFSMAGIPPLAGFFSKYFILAGCLDSNQYLLLFVALVSSAVSTFYYLGIAIDLLKSLNFCSKKKLRDHSSIYTRILLIMSISYIICLPLVLYNVINFLLEFSLSCLQPLSYF